MENSVDDMYHGCNDKKKEDLVKSQYPEELEMGTYANTWKKAETCATKKFEMRSKEDKSLTKHHMRAICVYTSNDVYSTFTEAVREQGKEYGTKEFQFHILHFLLTSAIQILNPSDNCQYTYRRTKVKYSGDVNQKIRFGTFASSSLKIFNL